MEEEKKEKSKQNSIEKQKEYREKNSDKIREKKKIYNEEHKEKIKEQSKKYYEENKETILEKLKVSMKGQFEINEVIDESLIGGFIVRMDDKEIDASVSSQFKNLKQRLTR